MQLSPVQVRVLGCLLEKERTTPDNYPLTMNALLAACNQTSNRYPVVSFNQSTLELAIDNLRAENLLRVVHSRSNRADRYRQVIDEVLGLDNAEAALLAVLMLRGPQTASELRARTERLHTFADQAEVDATLERLAARPEPLVIRLAPAAGQKGTRWAQLLSGEVTADMAPPAAEGPRTTRTDRLEALEEAVGDLRAEVDRLRVEQESLMARLQQLGL